MEFYSTLAANRNHSTKLQETVKRTVDRLLQNNTTSENPGVLLGRIQSGKTTAFIGVIADAFDKGIDVAVVLTKNSELLGNQTTRRIRKEFQDFEKNGHVNIYYTHTFGDTVLKKAQLLNKKVFIAIKNPSSIAKLTKSFEVNNSALCNKNVLIIDDEADTGSVGAKGKKEEVELLETAKKLNKFRSSLKYGYFLQVTATPYALYLQPNEIETASGIYKPVRPKFTEILTAFPGYVGGKVYFEDSEDIDNPAYHIHIQATSEDVVTLKSKKQDSRIEKNVATTEKLPAFRKAIELFIVAVAIRRAQEINAAQKELENYQLGKYSFIFHLDTGKTKMVWQETLVQKYLDWLKNEWNNNNQNAIIRYQNHFEKDLLVSLQKAKKLDWVNIIPPFDEISKIISKIFELEDYQIFVINSDQRIIDLANDDGQLRLETALNFFIGGQVLDRGITIDNLLGIFYGRDPLTSQMDTVLQHARMYGNRAKPDMALTRMYTTERIFERMKEIHQIDESLRESLQKNDANHEIVLLQASEKGNIKPTSPSKIKLGKVTTLRSLKTRYPYGFETKGKTELTRITGKIDSYLRSIDGFTSKNRSSFEISYEEFEMILDLIDSGNLNYDLGVPLDIIVWKTIVQKMLEECNSGTLHCYVQEGRDLQRFQANGEPMDAPYTSTTDYNYCIACINATNKPLLMLLRQNGTANGWKNAPFYWPILVNPVFERPLLFEWS